MRSYWIELRQFLPSLMMVVTLAQQFVAVGSANAQIACQNVHSPFRSFARFDFSDLKKAYHDPEAPSYYAALRRHLEWVQGQIAMSGGRTLLAKNPKGFPYLVMTADANFSHRMNRVAFHVLRRFEVEMVYDPDSLLRDVRRGAYSEEEQRIYVSAKSMEIGEPDATLLHEIRHVHYRNLQRDSKNGNPLLLASLRATGFEMDTTYYRKYFTLDELSAHLVNLYSYSRSMRQDDRQQWDQQDRRMFDIALLRIRDFARQTNQVANAALALLKKNDLAVRVKSGGLFTKSTQVWLFSPSDAKENSPSFSLREDRQDGRSRYHGKFTLHPVLAEKPPGTLDFDFQLFTLEFTEDWRTAMDSLPRRSSLFASEPITVTDSESWLKLRQHLGSMFSLYFEKTRVIEEDSRQLREQLAQGNFVGASERLAHLRATILDLYYP